ncbi:MAG: PQQ-dependent sugar dehydrogenase [Rhodothermales bacterium]
MNFLSDHRRNGRHGSVPYAAAILLFAAALLLSAGSLHAQARAVDHPDTSRFHQQVLMEGTLDEPIEVAVANDGTVFVIERKGALKRYDPISESMRLVEELEVDTHSENGLIGLALDPDFEENGWLYLNYSVDGALKHRVARFTFADGAIEEEQVLLEVPFDEGCCHTGGSMTFDARGNLYASFGDNTNPFDAGSYAPIDPTEGREKMDARRSSANTQDLRGKIIRITPRPDGTYTIPRGNLFEDPEEGRPEIYTMGHRNPYRISVDHHTGYLYWGEVGPDARADSTLGPKGYDEVNQARSAGNFGWPLFIADNKPYRDFNYTTGWMGELFDPARPINDSPNNTGARVLPPAQPAMIYYPYDASPEFPPVGEGGRNAMAGPVYYRTDFVDSNVRLPDYYDGKFIHYDWMRGWIMAVTMDANGDYVFMEPFLDHLTFDHPIDVELGPHGSLYVLEYGTYWHAKNENSRLSRITFHRGNRLPIPRLTASVTAGAAPLTATFSAEESFDHDPGDELFFDWEIEGAAASGPTVTHTFDAPGTYVVRLIVSDSEGASAEATHQLVVGNTPPDVHIALDGNRSFFWPDDSVGYRVDVIDAEDGRLGRGIRPGRVHVTFDYLPGGHIQGHLAVSEGLRLIEAGDCGACHGVDRASVGPSYLEVAGRYGVEATPYLVEKILDGGGGVWGEQSMAAHPQLASEDVEKMVAYILGLDDDGLPPSGVLHFDEHPGGERGAFVLTATYDDDPRQEVGSLKGRDDVVLRPPVLTVTYAADMHLIGPEDVSYPDGVVRSIATVYGDGAYLHFPDTDLTEIGRVRIDFRAEQHDFTVEIRDGGWGGRLLAGKHIEPGEASEWFEEVLPLSEKGMRDLYVVLRSNAEGLGQFNRMVRLGRLRFEQAD